MTTDQLITYYREQAETSPGLALAGLQQFIADHPWPAERAAAIKGLIAEVQAVIWEAELHAWLEANNIPDGFWSDYSVREGVIYYKDSAVNGD